MPTGSLEEWKQRIDDRLRRVEGWLIAVVVLLVLTSHPAAKLFEIATAMAGGK